MTTSVSELESAFHDYFEEIQRCLTAKCHWALVHVLVALPDICAALEHDDGETTGTRYRAWCGRHFPGAFRSPLDRWDIRCKVLHQGRTLPTRGEHRSYSFLLPGQPISLHDVVTTGDQNIAVDIGLLADETKTAVRAWFRWLQRPENAFALGNVQRHLPSLARMKRKTTPIVAGVDFAVWSSTST